MIICDRPVIETWSPNFSDSDVAAPVWTRIKFGQAVLCNALEWTEWNVNPVQVELCDYCGTVGCASGGYVNVSILGDLILWTMPIKSSGAEAQFAELYPATVIEKYGAVAFPEATWAVIRNATKAVPHASRLPCSIGRACRDAWAIAHSRPKSVERLPALLRARLLASDTLEVDEAIRAIEFWLKWFNDRSTTPIDAVLADPESIGATIEKLYFDGPGADDWSALARTSKGFLPAFGPRHVLVVNQGDPDAACLRVMENSNCVSSDTAPEGTEFSRR